MKKHGLYFEFVVFSVIIIKLCSDYMFYFKRKLNLRRMHNSCKKKNYVKTTSKIVLNTETTKWKC